MLPDNWDKRPDGVRAVAREVNQTQDGKALRCIGSVTLTANSATTALTDRRIGASSVILFMPTTANAKAEGTPAVTARGQETATLTHANNAQTDRSYDYAVIG